MKLPEFNIDAEKEDYKFQYINLLTYANCEKTRLQKGLWFKRGAASEKTTKEMS